MGFAFSLYNTDDVDPDLATGLTRWGPDPLRGEYDPRAMQDGRGSHVATLKGRKHQDSGVNIEDRRIMIAGSDMGNDLREDILAKYEVTDAEFNFTDGLGEVFRVKFSRRPRGFNAVINMPLFATGIMIQNPPPEKYRRYTYEVQLWILSQLV